MPPVPDMVDSFDFDHDKRIAAERWFSQHSICKGCSNSVPVCCYNGRVSGVHLAVRLRKL